MKFRTPYDGKRYRVSIDFTDRKTRTKQSFRDECNINNIMKKYVATGLVSHVKQYGGRYEDVSDAVDYRSAMDVMMRGREAFSTLPSALRYRFGNDPAEFLEFVSNPDNRDEMIKMGLMNKVVPEVAVPEVEVAVPPA